LEEIGDDPLESLVALVPHGGYGRRDLAPFSDVDLMLLHARDSEARVQPLAQRLTQDICDAGLQLGFSLRSPTVACSLAMSDVTILTSVAESRCLAGNEHLFSEFMDRLRRVARRKSRALIPAIERSRLEERMKYGATVYLLTPNIKRSRGGLRDIQLARWIAFARYGETDFANIEDADAINPDDRRRLHEAQEFLLRLRNELHFHAAKGHDVLDRDEQLRLADLYGYADKAGLMAVEQFMRDYFDQTGAVRYSVAHFVASAKTRRGVPAFLNLMASHNVQGDFRVGPMHIGATKRGLEKVRNDVGQVLRLMDLANLYNKRIDHRTWQAIRDSMAHRSTVELNREVIDRFLSLMSQPARLGDLLHRLHELRVLEKIVPGMSHARCLLQFNEYHKYTVDEHSIRTVEEATKFLDNEGPLGQAYRDLKNKRTLHLALLIHDLGKGHVEDHSEVGARLADETTRRLALPKREAETLRFLVHKHLLMSRLARLRDINDPDVITDFAVQVGSPELLQMLFVLTCADLAAVGPGVLNQWKLELFTQLYLSAHRQLTGDASAGALEEDRDRLYDDLRRRLGERAPDRWWRQQIDALPPVYLCDDPPNRVLDELARLRELSRTDAIAWGQYLPDRQAVEYTVGTYEDIVPGIFHRLAGVLSSQRMEILSAEINTLGDGLVLDRFYVHDNDFDGQPPEDRLTDVGERLTLALKKPTDQPPRFPQIWGRHLGKGPTNVARPPVQVRVDNNTSERFTILDIFAFDRMGLLYTISRELFELGLSVHIAKIGARVDQVVDVFYVTDAEGNKIFDEQRLEEIRATLLEKIVEFEETGQGT
jgi:[protein-PII] uridylyltransferase